MQQRFADALAAYSTAAALDSALTAVPRAWGALCGRGSLWNEAAAVLPACERAVALSAGSEKEARDAHYVRARARALTGDLEGAAADLEASLDPSSDESSAEDFRLRWIEALRAGRNPFTPELLAVLRER
jgi:hypothetical protein